MGRTFLSRSIARPQIIVKPPRFETTAEALNYWNGVPPPDKAVSINGRAVEWWPGHRFEYPGQAVGAHGLWVPADFHGARVKASYNAGVAITGAPNLDFQWGSTTAGSGTFAVTDAANKETEMVANADADQSYLRWPSSGDFDAPTLAAHLIYMKVSSHVGGGTANGASVRVQFYDGVRLVSYYLTYAATNMQFAWQYTTADPYPRSGGLTYGTDFVEIMLRARSHLGADGYYEALDYTSFRTIGDCSIGDFSASGTRALFVGNSSGSYSGKLKIRGFPALALIGF